MSVEGSPEITNCPWEEKYTFPNFENMPHNEFERHMNTFDCHGLEFTDSMFSVLETQLMASDESLSVDPGNSFSEKQDRKMVITEQENSFSVLDEELNGILPPDDSLSEGTGDRSPETNARAISNSLLISQENSFSEPNPNQSLSNQETLLIDGGIQSARNLLEWQDLKFSTNPSMISTTGHGKSNRVGSDGEFENWFVGSNFEHDGNSFELDCTNKYQEVCRLTEMVDCMQEVDWFELLSDENIMDPYVKQEALVQEEIELAHKKIYHIPDMDYMKYIYQADLEQDFDMVNVEDLNPQIWSIFTEEISYVSAECDSKVAYKGGLKSEETDSNLKSDSNLDVEKEEERYEDLEPFVVENFDPDRDIAANYLWKTHDPRYTPSVIENHTERVIPNSIFKTGMFPINKDGKAQGYLLDDQKTAVKTLIDSGASKPMLNKSFYYQNHFFMKKYPRYKINPRYLRIANDQLMKVDECVHLMIQFGEFVFEIIAYLVEMARDFDFIIGQKAMYELEGGIDFGKLVFHFTMKSIDLFTLKDYVIKPNESQYVILEMERCPVGFSESPHAIVKLKQATESLIPATLKVPVVNKKIKIQIFNNGAEDIFLKKGETLGCMDMRSLGYFHVSRNILQMLLEERCDFLDDEKSEKYIEKIVNSKPMDRFCKACSTRLRSRTSDGEKDTNMVPNEKEDPYPWLNEDDPRRNMTDEQILRKLINLDESCLNSKQKEDFMQTIIKYREAFSLRDEIGLCPHMQVELELSDTTPFFIRPFPIAESEKALVDKEMRKGVLLGILKKGMSSYSSPIMLIPRKLTGIPRIVTDFRFLNSRLKVLNPSIPLVRDAVQMIGSSGCEVLSVIDLRDAYHTLRLSPNSQQFCGITPYYGGDTYIYQRLGMGLSVSPAIWQSFINTVLGQIPLKGGKGKNQKKQNFGKVVETDGKRHHLAIMDDVCVFSKLNTHEEHLIDLFEALIHNGLKISPKKCQLYRKKLIYMGHYMLIENNIPCMTPLKTRLEAIEKLGPLKTAKNCKQFCGMVNYMSMYLEELQKTLIPIYNLTKKGMPFHWGEVEQTAYEKIKKQLVSPPVLVMPNSTGHFILVTDTSKIATGAALYQEIKQRYRLVGYYSKKLPDACSRYSISELEFTGLVACISAFKHLLKNVEFTVYVDHSALVHILKGKREAATLRLKKLLEQISQYSFKINYLKGKEMYISDFLSRHPDNDTGSPNEIIPIAFMSVENVGFHSSTLTDNWHNFEDPNKIIESHVCDKCFISTRSMTRDVPQMYPLTGDNRKPEYSSNKYLIKEKEKEEREKEEGDNIDKDIERLEREMGESEQNPSSELSNKLPSFDSNKIFDLPDILPNEADLQVRKEQLLKFIRNETIFRKHIPKQHELNKFLNKLKRKVIHDFHVPLSAKELKAEYKNSPFFRDIIKYITNGYCSYVGKAQKVFKAQCEDYIVIEGLLFRFKFDKQGNEELVLCVPEKFIPRILHQYHSSILSGHPGVTRLYNQIRRKFFFPGLYTICRQFVISCFECQSRKKKRAGLSINYPRVPLDYKPMSRISMDVKYMPKSNMGFHHILLCTCEITGYVVGIPIANLEAQTIAEAIFYKIICIYGTPELIIIDEAKSLTSDLMLTYFDSLHIQPFVISPFNHGSNKTERYIRTLNDMICKYLENKGEDWPKHVHPCCYAMNSQISMVTGFSPYEMVFLRKPPSLLDFEFDPDKHGIKIGVNTYMDIFHQRLKDMKKLVLERKIKEMRTQWIRDIRGNPDEEGFSEGDLVYLNFEYGSELKTESKKLKQEWVGPLRISVILDDTHYLVTDWEGLFLPIKVHVNRLKIYNLNLGTITQQGLLDLATNVKRIKEKWEEIKKQMEEQNE